jgi:hypothetical protein
VTDHFLRRSDLTIKGKLEKPGFAEENLLTAFNTKLQTSPAKKYLPVDGANSVMLATDDLIASKSNDHEVFKLVSDYLTGKEDLSNMSDVDYETLLDTVVLNRASGPSPISTPGVLNLFRSNFDSHEVTTQLGQDNNTLTNTSELKEYNVPADRFSNPVSLRATAKSLSGTYDAYQKVSKQRFDENRSNFRLESFAQLDFDQPLISRKVPFTRLLGKNSENFFSSNFSNQTSLPYFNYETFSKNASNFSFYDFPFELSFTNDMTRYLWFD